MSTVTNKIDFNAKKGFICDMDGVIYHGNRILPGAPETADATAICAAILVLSAGAVIAAAKAKKH